MTEQDWLSPHSVVVLYGELSAIVQPRKLFLLGATFLRRAWPLLPGEGVRLAVETTEAYTVGRASVRDLLESWTRAEEATGDGVWLDRDTANYSYCPCCQDRAELNQTGDVYPGVRAAIRDPAWFAARAVGLAVELVADDAEPGERNIVRQHERQQQWAVYTDLVGDPYAPKCPAPVRLDDHPDLRKLLAGVDVREPRDPLGLLALADAVEEAGVADKGLLAHLRSQGPHVKGCWAIERLWGRELVRLPVEEKRGR